MKLKKLFIALLFIIPLLLLASCDLSLPFSHAENISGKNTTTTSRETTSESNSESCSTTTSSNTSTTSETTSGSQTEVYTIRFYVGDDVYITEVVIGNAKVQKPSDPEKSGYNFLGWTIGETSQYFNFESSVKKDLNLYAKFEPIQEFCYISLYVDGEYYDSKIVEYDAIIAEPLAPSKEGYTFVYWTIDQDLLNKYSFDEPITSNLVLYAKYLEGEFDRDSIDRIEVIENSVKTRYKVGESLDLNGMEAYIVYKNGDRVLITSNLSARYQNLNSYKAGVYPITIVYTDEFKNEYTAIIYITYEE